MCIPLAYATEKAYIIENSTATLLSETSDTISDVYGSVCVPNDISRYKGAIYKIPAVLVTETSV